MKFSISKDDLVYAVNAVERAASGKNTLPILGGIMICAKEDQKIVFKATDMEMAIACTVNGEVELPGEAVVPGKKFSALVKLLPGDTIQLSGGAERLEIAYNGGHQSVPCYVAEEFPLLPERSGQLEGKISIRLLRRLVRQVGIAASNEEVRPVFTGIYTELKKDGLTMVATDSYRLALGRGQWEGSGELSLLIPNRTLQEIAHLAVNEDDFILLTASKTQIYFSFANLTVTSRVIMGLYPDYHQVIPKAETYCGSICFNRQAMIQVLERASLVSRDAGRARNSLIRMEINSNVLMISAEVPDEGMIREEVAAQISCADMSINFNARYLLDCLRSMNDDTVLLNLTGASTPGVITSADEEEREKQNYLYLLLPVRVSKPTE